MRDVLLEQVATTAAEIIVNITPLRNLGSRKNQFNQSLNRMNSEKQEKNYFCILCP